RSLWLDASISPGVNRSVYRHPNQTAARAGRRAPEAVPMNDLRALRPLLPIFVGASLLLTLSMGLRQSLGILIPPLTADIGISVGQFTLAVAIQNLAWGFFQPFAGAWADRLGYRRLMLGGAA